MERNKEKDAFHAVAKAAVQQRDAARQAAKERRATWERQVQLQKGRERYVTGSVSSSRSIACV